MHLTPKIRYASFMLRLQWTQSDDHPTWMISMQSTKTGELRWFPNLNALIKFLQDEFGGYEELKVFQSIVLPETDHQLPKNR